MSPTVGALLAFVIVCALVYIAWMAVWIHHE